MEHPLYVARGHVDIMIDGQLLTEHLKVFSQQSVIVERANQVFHHVVLLVAHVELTHLLLQLVIERGGLTKHHLLALIVHSIAPLINGQFLIITTNATEGLVEGRLSFFALRNSLKVLVG